MKFSKKDRKRNQQKKPFSRDSSESGSSRSEGSRGEQAGDGAGGFVVRDRSGKVHRLGASQQRSGQRPEKAYKSSSGRVEDRAFDRGARGHGKGKSVPLPDDAQLRQSERAKKKKDKDRGHSQERLGRVDRSGRPDRYDRSAQSDHRGGFREGRRKDRRERDLENVQRLRAVVDKNRKGFAFLVFDSKEQEDAFVPPHEADQLFHGDRVEVALDARGRVVGLRVLSHRFRELVGRYFPLPANRGRGAQVIYERKRAREEVYCPKPHPTAQPGDWVRCRLDFVEGDDENLAGVTGEVVEVFGQDIPPRADVGMVAAEYNLIEEHSEAAEREAKSFKLDTEDRHRTDLRNVPFITIDGETARDFDDAVYVERDRSGFVLWVAIADVSHYVKPGTALDDEARSRGTSVYFPERAFHMLPRALSENLCSLRPHEPRLAMVARMEFDRQGKRTSTEIMDALIESRRRATYTEIQQEWEQHRGDTQWEYAPHFELYQLIRKQRSQRGSIDFDLPEAEMRVRPTGEVDSIKIRARLDAHRLIEEFMIAANEAVTAWMMERDWPFVYRTHEEPSEQALDRFKTLAWHVGIEVKLQGGGARAGKKQLHEQLVEVLENIEGHPAQTLLNTAMLRSMKQAVYSAVHGGHFGLASPGYTHFTSPIRRYPDLVVHRLLRWALQVEQRRKQALRRDERERLEKELDETCEHCSYRERIAADAERESIKLKQVRAMLDRKGEEFDGRIIGMIEAGFFVQINDPYVEGMVGRDSLGDDFYQFDEERLVFSGRRKNRTFRIGDTVRVRALKADIDTRTIDFELVSHEPTSNPLHALPTRSRSGGKPSFSQEQERERGLRKKDRGGEKRFDRKKRKGRRR